MFERFTDQARLVLLRARETALEHHDTNIGPDHLLFALIDLNSDILEGLLGPSQDIRVLRQELQIPPKASAARLHTKGIRLNRESQLVLRHASDEAISDWSRVEPTRRQVRAKSAERSYQGQLAARSGTLKLAVLKVLLRPLRLVPHQTGRIEPRHILIGLLHLGDSSAANILIRWGVTLERLRKQ